MQAVGGGVVEGGLHGGAFQNSSRRRVATDRDVDAQQLGAEALFLARAAGAAAVAEDFNDRPFPAIGLGGLGWVVEALIVFGEGVADDGMEVEGLGFRDDMFGIGQKIADVFQRGLVEVRAAGVVDGHAASPSICSSLRTSANM